MFNIVTVIFTLAVTALFDFNPFDRIIFIFWLYYRKFILSHSPDEIITSTVMNNDMLGTRFILSRYKATPYDFSIKFAFENDFYYMVICLLEEFGITFDVNQLNGKYSDRIENYLHMKRTYYQNIL